MGFPASDRVSVLRRTQDTDQNLLGFVYGTVTLYGQTFQKVLLPNIILISVLQPRFHIENGLG